MLDQNTDRMWYVIGAVIVGAALIFIMNGSVPSIFASVSDIFRDKTDETNSIVEEIVMPEMGDGINLLEPLGLTSPAWRETRVSYTANSYMSGYLSLDELGLHAGDTFTVSVDHDFEDYKLVHRVMFSPFEGEPDDEREINMISKTRYTGSGRMEHTVVVPDKSKYMMLMFENKYSGQGGGFIVKSQRIKVERGSYATPY